MKKNIYLKVACGILIPVFLLVSGCTTVKKTFVSEKVVNLEPFVEQLITLIGNIQFGTEVRTVYLESYLDIPDVVEVVAMSDQFKFNCGKIISYSSKVIALAQSDFTDMEKIEILVDFMESLRPFQKQPVMVEFGMSLDEVDRLIAEAGGQEKFLDALMTIQPIVDELSVYMRTMIDEIHVAFDDTVEVVLGNINKNHKDLLGYLATMANRRDDVLLRLQYLTDYRAGNKDVLKALAKGDPEIEKALGAGGEISYKVLNQVETVLTDRLQLLDRQNEYLASGMAAYYNERNELNSIVDKTDETLQNSKLAILLWNRVHRMMAEGITDPAKINVFGIMTGAADKLI
jgi:hypothetical protein